MSKPMHIAFVAQPYDAVLPPTQSSIGLWTYHVGRRLARGNRVTVYLKRPQYAADATGNDGIDYVFMPSLPDLARRALDRASRPLSRPGRPPFAALHSYFEYALLVALDLRRRRPDVVHIHNLTQFVPIIRALNPSAILVLHMQAEWLSQLGYGLMERRIRQVDRVIGCSDHITNLVRQRFPQLAARCATINNGFDATIFNQASAAATGDGRSLLFVGRVSPEKGVHLLLDAFRQIAPRFPDARIDIVGPGGSLPRSLIVDLSDDPLVQGLARFYDGRTYQEHLDARIPADLKSRVVFHGGMAQAATAAFYRQAAVLVNPSLSESFGMSVVEAGSLGVPAVVSRVGGMQETVIDRQTGLIVAPDDADDLARALDTLLEHDERRRAMGEAARARCLDRYSWDRISSDTHALYRDTAEQHVRNSIRAQSNPRGL